MLYCNKNNEPEKSQYFSKRLCYFNICCVACGYGHLTCLWSSHRSHVCIAGGSKSQVTALLEIRNTDIEIRGECQKSVLVWRSCMLLSLSWTSKKQTDGSATRCFVHKQNDTFLLPRIEQKKKMFWIFFYPVAYSLLQLSYLGSCCSWQD
jgi:hypothetical protein